MRASIAAKSHIDILARVYQLILSWDGPDKKETADRHEFGDLDQSAEKGNEPEGLSHYEYNCKGGSNETV